MKEENAIEVKNIEKSFKIYLDKGNTIKDKVVTKGRGRYEKRQVLKGISFEIKKGEAVGFIGHNGCGKSTTLKLLSKIMYPDSGTIEMKGRVSSLIELGAGFHPDLSGRENIYINASIFGLSKKEIDERLEEIIEFSELEDFIDNPVRTYSSGMYMRLAFAVAINVDADILLVDEILSVGDANFQAKCFERLLKLKKSGVTIVIVSHDTGSIKRFCDRSIWINNGEIADIGESMRVVDTYLEYMSEKRVERVEKEEKKTIEIKNDQDNKKEENNSKKDKEYKNINDEEVEVKEDEMHFGNRKVILKSVELLNSEGKKTTVLKAREKFSLRYHYEVNEAIDELNIGMGIFTMDGTWIFGTNTLISNLRVPCNPNGGTLLFECEPLKLLTGDYRLQVAVVDLNGEPLDYHQDYMHFKVVNHYPESGFIHYDTKWRIISEE